MIAIITKGQVGLEMNSESKRYINWHTSNIFLLHMQLMTMILTAGQVGAIDCEPIVTLAQPLFTLRIWVVAKFSSLTSTSDFPW